MTNVVITGTGLFTPEHTIDNDALVASFNAWVGAENARRAEAGIEERLAHSSSEFIVKASGIHSRHVLDAEGILDPERMRPRLRERSNDEPSIQCEMGSVAARQALTRAGVEAADIDLVIVGCSNLERPYPAVAVELQAALGAGGYAFDMNVACSSATFAIETAANAIRAGSARRALGARRQQLALDLTAGLLVEAQHRQVSLQALVELLEARLILAPRLLQAAQLDHLADHSPQQLAVAQRLDDVVDKARIHRGEQPGGLAAVADHQGRQARAERRPLLLGERPGMGHHQRHLRRQLVGAVDGDHRQAITGDGLGQGVARRAGGIDHTDELLGTVHGKGPQSEKASSKSASSKSASSKSKSSMAKGSSPVSPSLISKRRRCSQASRMKL